MNILTKECYLVLDISFVVYFYITNVKVLDTCRIGVRAIVILSDVKEVTVSSFSGWRVVTRDNRGFSGKKCSVVL
jgi:hypothetical protein